MSRQKEQAGRVAQSIVEWQNAVQSFDEVAAQSLGVNLTDLRCLSLLTLAGPMPAGSLAQASGLTTGAITAAIDRWERANLAYRRRSVEDRRSVFVELTPSAKKRIEAIWGPLAQQGNTILMGYSEDELMLIADFLGKCIRLQLDQSMRLKKQVLNARSVPSGRRQTKSACS